MAQVERRFEGSYHHFVRCPQRQPRSRSSWSSSHSPRCHCRRSDRRCAVARPWWRQSWRCRHAACCRLRSSSPTSARRGRSVRVARADNESSKPNPYNPQASAHSQPPGPRDNSTATFPGCPLSTRRPRAQGVARPVVRAATAGGRAPRAQRPDAPPAPGTASSSRSRARRRGRSPRPRDLPRALRRRRP